MGNRHSTHTAGRRPSLAREEFMIPELDLEWDYDWEVCYVQIELKPLPSQARNTVHVCVHDYTQEILSWEELGCVCACASTGERNKRHLPNESDAESVCGCPQNESDDDFCMQWDVYDEELLDTGQVDTGNPNLATVREFYFEENVASVTVTDSADLRLQDCSQLDNPHGQDFADTNSSCPGGIEKPFAQSKHTARTDPPGSTNVLRNAEFNKGLFSPKTLETKSSLNEDKRREHDTDGDTASDAWTDGRQSVASSGTRQSLLVSQTDTDQDPLSVCSSGAPHPRKKSCSIPVPKANTTPHVSKKRKFSLKDEPGWIPNPLDSDSEGSDLEDSGVFHEFSGSSRTSTCPTHRVALTSTATAKSRALLTERRRCNSEPMPGTSTSSSTSPTQRDKVASPLSSSPASESSTKPRTRRGSGWKLVRFPGKRSSKTQSEDHPVQAEDSPQDEDDLIEQLKWFTMSDSQLSHDAETSSDQSEEDLSSRREHSSSSDTSPPPPNINPSVAELADDGDSAPSDPAAGQRVSRFDGELELDWLCEPEWNNLELELFWSVLRPHLEHLLQPEDSELLPDACGAVCHMDADDSKMLDRCLLHVQWHIWRGSYRQAVADFRAIRRHFLCCAQSQLIESGTRDDVESLRLIFQRKRPYRFRLWI
ncbi:uncharacterized protein LOC143288869 [Babylonia areolata]|uniref:uncharacterized protein LOC143288869 n=1 Tax=Babylonia areolata TaxID=304850 RepID=UPI003FCFB537